MPLGEIAAEIARPVLRLLGHFFVEVIFEIAVKGLGYLLCRPFSKSVDIDGGAVLIVGIIAWLGIGFAGYSGFEWLQANRVANA